jgi:MoaA/NifB/PqqE/SkfB family radical SAM enzyme
MAGRRSHGQEDAVKLSGLHLLLTYRCLYECDHCFVWGSPGQTGTMTLRAIDTILAQAKELGTVESIYFEGGEPFLFYPVLLEGARRAHALGFSVGIVTNAYWATEEEDALEWLRPLAGLVEDLTVSTDLFHGDEEVTPEARAASAAAGRLRLPLETMSIARPEGRPDRCGPTPQTGQLPPGQSEVMIRGRAAEKLVEGRSRRPWMEFTSCPHEELRRPERVHIDPLGYVHLCQGLSLGNVFRTDLREICKQYDPDRHPVAGPLLAGGPAELRRRYGLSGEKAYADACHLCYEMRRALRTRFPEILAPDQMYGVTDETPAVPPSSCP